MISAGFRGALSDAPWLDFDVPDSLAAIGVPGSGGEGTPAEEPSFWSVDGPPVFLTEVSLAKAHAVERTTESQNAVRVVAGDIFNDL